MEITLPNAGFYYVSTPYSYNTYTNFIVTVQQVPDFTALNAATGSTIDDVDRIQIQSRESTVKRHTLSGATYTYTDGTQNTYNSTWRYTYGVTYENAGSGEVSGYCIDLFLQNTQWTDHYNDGSNTFYRLQGMTYNNRDYLGPVLWVQVFFGLDDGHDTSNGGRFRSSSAALTRVEGLVSKVSANSTSMVIKELQMTIELQLKLLILEHLMFLPVQVQNH